MSVPWELNLGVEPSLGERTGGPASVRARRLVGRDTEVREVLESVATAPITTLTGPGGVGKTALAMAVVAACAPEFAGGVTVVWLGSLRSAELVAAEVASQLGLPRLGGQSYEEALLRWLGDRDVLLVIDICEHVLSAVADLIETLSSRLPRLRVCARTLPPRTWNSVASSSNISRLSIRAIG